MKDENKVIESFEQAPPPPDRRRRAAALDRLFILFEGHDAAEEVRRLKEQDRHW